MNKEIKESLCNKSLKRQQVVIYSSVANSAIFGKERYPMSRTGKTQASYAKVCKSLMKSRS